MVEAVEAQGADNGVKVVRGRLKACCRIKGEKGGGGLEKRIQMLRTRKK